MLRRGRDGSGESAGAWQWWVGSYGRVIGLSWWRRWILPDGSQVPSYMSISRLIKAGESRDAIELAGFLRGPDLLCRGLHRKSAPPS